MCNNRYKEPYTIIGSYTNYNQCPSCKVDFSYSIEIPYIELKLEEKSIEERICDIEIKLGIRQKNKNIEKKEITRNDLIDLED